MVFNSLLLLLFCGASLANAQSAVSLDRANYLTSQTIVASFKGGSGNAKDWIGIYPAGVTPGSVASTLWYYVDGTKSSSAGKTSGTITFTNGLANVGDWVAYFLENDGYNVLAQAAFKVLPAPTLATDKPSYSTNENITVTFSRAPGNPKDWVGIYPEGAVLGQVNSTLWFYLDGTKNGVTIKTNGVLTFTNGLSAKGNWVAYLLENDGYTKLASAAFSVGSVQQPPTVLSDHSAYFPNTKIDVSFSNGPAHPKDWVGIYSEGQNPGGGPAATIWKYTDGGGGTSGVASGIISFNTGLTKPGKYLVYFLENDGYKILASNNLAVVESNAPLLQLNKRSYLTKETIVTSFTNGPANPKDWVGIYPQGIVPGQVPSTIWFYVDGTRAGADGLASGTVKFDTGLNGAGNWVAYLLENDGYTILASDSFTVVSAPISTNKNIILPSPIYLETFDATPEGQLPAGWKVVNHTDVDNDALDLGDLNSRAYADWVVVSAARFTNRFITYSNPDTPDSEATDYKRVLSSNPENIVNGKAVNDLATGRFLFANSGYRHGNQVQYVFTPDFNLSGKTSVYLSYHSLYEQNQDSLGAVEYSIDGGTNWLPVVYMLDGPDVVRDANGNIDAVATFNTERGDVARYSDPISGEAKGGTYGTFIGAPISADLAPYISARVNDDPVESKRVELFRLPKADNQAKVRFRLAQAGTDSWYFGVDDFGLYSIPASGGQSPSLTLNRAGNQITLSWPSDIAGFTLESADTLVNPSWTAVAGVTGNSVKVTLASGTKFFRLRK